MRPCVGKEGTNVSLRLAFAIFYGKTHQIILHDHFSRRTIWYLAVFRKFKVGISWISLLKGNSAKSDKTYDEIRKRIECAPVVGADETGAAVGKQLHWNWIFQTDALTYVYQLKSRGQEAVDSKFPNGLPHSTLVTDRKQTYFKMNVKDHQVCLAHLLRNAEYLNELDAKQDWSRRFIHLLAHAIDLRRNKTITQRKIKVLKTKMKNLLGESLSHLDDEFERFKKAF